MKQKNQWTLWFTGRHGAGKSTIADGIIKELSKKNVPAVLIDGDEARKTVSSDLGYSVSERNEHMKRMAGVCSLISKSGVIAVASVASPTEESRKQARKILKKMLLIYVNCPKETCMKRDVKGHYKKSTEGKKGFENFLGKSFDYEEPNNADVILNTHKETAKESVEKLAACLKSKGII